MGRDDVGRDDIVSTSAGAADFTSTSSALSLLLAFLPFFTRTFFVICTCCAACT
jgi:hypothetical protein